PSASCRPPFAAAITLAPASCSGMRGTAGRPSGAATRRRMTCMSPARRTLVVLPAFNESESVAHVISEIRNELPDVGCLVIDDGSSDDTAGVARDAGATVVQLP